MKIKTLALFLVGISIGAVQPASQAKSMTIDDIVNEITILRSPLEVIQTKAMLSDYIHPATGKTIWVIEIIAPVTTSQHRWALAQAHRIITIGEKIYLTFKKPAKVDATADHGDDTLSEGSK